MMGGQSLQSYTYTPLSKPIPAPTLTPYLNKRNKLDSLTILAVFCSFSYLLASWKHSGAIPPYPGATTTIHCLAFQNTTALIDFAVHHGGNTAASVSAVFKPFLPGDIKYSKYTPCEDQQRSLKFDRDRLIYRERHCPEKEEVLKCRVLMSPEFSSSESVDKLDDSFSPQLMGFLQYES